MQQDALVQAAVRAAQAGDRLAFAAAARRLGSLEEAQAAVRSSALVCMVERVAAPELGTLGVGVPEVELRAEDAEGGEARTMVGHFAVFNEHTEINSWYEGNFVESIAPGAFRKTFREQDIKVLFQHGSDPVVGDKPLGRAEVLREDEQGAYYEVPLLQASYVDDLVPGLRANLYGASFRFMAMREEWIEEPDESEHNPRGIPERVLKELRVAEFGPVTFPAYPSATAGLRSAGSLTAAEVERVRSLLAEHDDAPPSAGAGAEPHPGEAAGAEAQSHPSNGRRGTAPLATTRQKKEGPRWRL